MPRPLAAVRRDLEALVREIAGTHVVGLPENVVWACCELVTAWREADRAAGKADGTPQPARQRASGRKTDREAGRRAKSQ